MFRKLLPPLIAGMALAAVVLPNVSAATTGENPGNVRDATAAFRDPTAALAAGYDLLTDASGIACIDMPGAGTMGIHYVKGALVQAGTIDPARPQALVYEQNATDAWTWPPLSTWSSRLAGTPRTMRRRRYLENSSI